MYQKKRGFFSNLSQLSTPGYVWEVIANKHNEYILQWRNDPENMKLFDSQELLTLEGQIYFLKFYDQLDRVDLVLQKDNNPIGVFNIKNLETMPEFGALIGDRSYRGKGVGYLAKISILEYWFNVLMEPIIYVRNKKTNVKVLESNLRLGFKIISEDDISITLSLSRESYRNLDVR